MVLIPAQLQAALEERWLVEGGGAYPASVQESAARFADAVATWFVTATSNLVPCATALARKSGLESQAATALAAAAPPAAGALLAVAVASYIAGQTFGPGVAAMPLATAGVSTMLAAVFSNLSATREERARDVALACWVLALSTLVTFPVIGPMPIL